MDCPFAIQDNPRAPKIETGLRISRLRADDTMTLRRKASAKARVRRATGYVTVRQG